MGLLQRISLEIRKLNEWLKWGVMWDLIANELHAFQDCLWGFGKGMALKNHVCSQNSMMGIWSWLPSFDPCPACFLAVKPLTIVSRRVRQSLLKFGVFNISPPSRDTALFFWGSPTVRYSCMFSTCERRCSCWQTSQGIAWKPTSSFTARSLAPVRKASFCPIELETQSMKGALMHTCFWQGMHGNMQSSCWRNWFSPCKWQLGRYIFRPCSFNHL